MSGFRTSSQNSLRAWLVLKLHPRQSSTCREGNDPLFGEDRWVRWPKDANQDGVLSWLSETVEKLATFAEIHKTTPTVRRRPLAQPYTPIKGSTGERKLDVGFVSDTDAGKNSRCHWEQILVPGELKSNPGADIASKAWLDLGRYAREVLSAQDTRRYVLGFTLCGSYLGIWEFDRLGGIASEKFDIHKDPRQFVSTIIGFLWRSDGELGFDPSFLTINGQRCIEIERNGQLERLIIDQVIRRSRCIAGRATTCWKAHREGHPQQSLVTKDSWQYTERAEEGELLRETMDKGVINVVRHYHHETVRVLGVEDDILSNVRKGLDITTAENYRTGLLPSRRPSAANTPRKSRSTTSVKRSSSPASFTLRPAKRRCISQSPTEPSNTNFPNRIHRRIVMRDYGRGIYRASSPMALLRAFEGCIKGHQSLRSRAGVLHRDISINNLMINEDSNNPSWPEFLIDLDLAVHESRIRPSGAQGRTGTRAFMSIGALVGNQHSFMDDLESFFWVLYWICRHYDGPGQGKFVPKLDTWNFMDMEQLAKVKLRTVGHERMFSQILRADFTDYYQPLIPCAIELRRVVFPGGGKWEVQDDSLYTSMIEVLHAAQQDECV